MSVLWIIQSWRKEGRLIIVVFFALLPSLNVEGIMFWMVLSILLVYTTFTPSFSMQGACSLSCLLCVILHPLPSLSMCKLPCHHRSSSPHGFPVLGPYLAVIPVDSQILLVWMEPCCPWPEPALSCGTCLCEVKECKARPLLM